MGGSWGEWERDREVSFERRVWISGGEGGGRKRGGRGSGRGGGGWHCAIGDWPGRCRTRRWRGWSRKRRASREDRRCGWGWLRAARGGGVGLQGQPAGGRGGCGLDR